MPAVPDVPEPCPAGRQPLHLILMLNLKRNCIVLLLEWYEIHILPFFNFTNNFSIIIRTCISRCECVSGGIRCLRFLRCLFVSGSGLAAAVRRPLPGHTHITRGNDGWDARTAEPTQRVLCVRQGESTNADKLMYIITNTITYLSLCLSAHPGEGSPADPIGWEHAG